MSIADVRCFNVQVSAAIRKAIRTDSQLTSLAQVTEGGVAFL